MSNFNQTREFIKYAQKYIAGNVLDLGAGVAKYKKIICRSADKYTAFDIVPNKNVDIVGDILHTGLPDNSFDTIICTQVFEHIQQPWLAVKEIQRLLKPNGKCILTAPFLEPYHADPHDYFRYTQQGLESLFKNENFKIIESGIMGKNFLVLQEFLRFTWFNPYKKYKHGSYKINKTLYHLAKFFNRFTRSKIIYANSYLIIQKYEK